MCCNNTYFYNTIGNDQYQLVLNSIQIHKGFYDKNLTNKANSTHMSRAKNSFL